MPLRRPEAILLDAGGVLQLPSPDIINAAIAPSRRSTATIDRACYVGGEAYSRASSDGEVSSQCQAAFVHAYVTSLDIPAGSRGSAVHAVGHAFSRPAALWTRTAPGAQAGLAALASVGLPLAIVSNADGTVEQRLADAGIVQVGRGAGVEVAFVIHSTVLGVAKPDPRIFTHASTASGSPPLTAGTSATSRRWMSTAPAPPDSYRSSSIHTSSTTGRGAYARGASPTSPAWRKRRRERCA
jgi:FMN phosphatase YigB (HAD superfamily)